MNYKLGEFGQCFIIEDKSTEAIRKDWKFASVIDIASVISEVIEKEKQ